MGKIKNALYRMMYGRYGSDTLNKVLTGVYIVCVVLYSILSLWINSAIFSLAYILVTVALIFAIFGRMFSRNIEKRRRENQKFCGFFKLRRNKFRDRKTHVYYKCPRCKAMLRLPRAKGKHTVICPRCQNRFPVKK